jgi:hypothetical protein
VGLDIRLPIGLMFTLFGLMLATFGLTSNEGIYRRSLGINVNLWWGLIMLFFGLTMFLYSRRGGQTMRSTDTSPDGDRNGAPAR